MSVSTNSFVFAAFLVLGALTAGRASAAPLEFKALTAGTGFTVPLPSARPLVLSPAQALGLSVVDPERFLHRGYAGYHEHTLFADPARAHAYEAELKNEPRTQFTRSDTCFATVNNFSVPDARSAQPLEWDSFSADQLTVQSYPNDTSTKVIPVRAERWVETDDGKLHVETTLFWADKRSGGTRLVARSNNELTRVASPFEGVAVYAFREGAGAVTFFVRRDAPRDPAAPGVDPLTYLGTLPVARVQGGGFDLSAFRTTTHAGVRLNPCAFEHIELELRGEPGVDDSAEHAESTALRPQKRKGPSDPIAPPRDIASVVFAVVLGLDSDPAQAPGQGSVNFPASVERRSTARTRTMVVNLGLARSPNQGPPVPSVSYRWLDGVRAVSF